MLTVHEWLTVYQCTIFACVLHSLVSTSVHSRTWLFLFHWDLCTLTVILKVRYAYRGEIQFEGLIVNLWPMTLYRGPTENLFLVSVFLSFSHFLFPVTQFLNVGFGLSFSIFHLHGYFSSHFTTYSFATLISQFLFFHTRYRFSIAFDFFLPPLHSLCH